MRFGRAWIVGVLVLLSGCSMWPQARSDSGRSGFNPSETKIGLATFTNDPLLRNRFISVVRPQEPVVGSDGFTYVGDAGGDVGAYDIRACAPGRCRPAFSAPGSDPSLTHGMLLASGNFDDGVFGYDPHGARNCGGTPVVCAPVYNAAAVQYGNPATHVGEYVVDGDVLYVFEYFNDEGEHRRVVAYDLKGVQGCRHSPTEVVCDEMWESSFGTDGSQIDVGRLAATAGRVFLRENDGGGQAVVALDSTGVVWSAPGDFTGDPVVAEGLVWVSRRTGEVDAFDAAGQIGCSGAPKVCTPVRTAVPPSPTNGYAVSDGRLYVGTTDGHLEVFDATGAAGCSGAPSVCAPLWSADDDPGVAINEPTIANGVVYAVSANGDVDGLDAAGVVRCDGTPKLCHRVFHDTGGTAPVGSAVVADGRLFVRKADLVTIYTPE